jgi:hypothetical protein
MDALREAVEEQAQVEASYRDELAALEAQVQEMKKQESELRARRERATISIQAPVEAAKDLDTQCKKVSALEDTHVILLGLQLWKVQELSKDRVSYYVKHPDESRTEVEVAFDSADDCSSVACTAVHVAGARTPQSEMVSQLVRAVDCEALLQSARTKRETLDAMQQAELRFGRMHKLVFEIIDLEKKVDCMCSANKAEGGLTVTATFSQPACKSRFEVEFQLRVGYPFASLDYVYRNVYGKVCASAEFLLILFCFVSIASQFVGAVVFLCYY